MPEKHDGVYRELSADMRAGLRQIYRQISSASIEEDATRSEALFSEASDQLQEVVKATESAAMNIMDIVEKQLELAEANARLLDSIAKQMPADEIAALRENNEKLTTDLTNVLTALSFQDITGQRIKKALGALKAIESSVVDLYLSSGLVMEAAEKNPHKSAGAIRAEARKAVDEYRENKKEGSELKGPDVNGISQDAIDGMLAQLGL